MELPLISIYLFYLKFIDNSKTFSLLSITIMRYQIFFLINLGISNPLHLIKLLYLIKHLWLELFRLLKKILHDVKYHFNYLIRQYVHA